MSKKPTIPKDAAEYKVRYNGMTVSGQAARDYEELQKSTGIKSHSHLMDYIIRGFASAQRGDPSHPVNTEEPNGYVTTIADAMERKSNKELMQARAFLLYVRNFRKWVESYRHLEGLQHRFMNGMNTFIVVVTDGDKRTEIAHMDAVHTLFETIPVEVLKSKYNPERFSIVGELVPQHSQRAIITLTDEECMVSDISNLGVFPHGYVYSPSTSPYSVYHEYRKWFLARRNRALARMDVAGAEFLRTYIELRERMGPEATQISFPPLQKPNP